MKRILGLLANRTKALRLRFLLSLGLLVAGGPAIATNTCKSAHGRLEKAICASPTLRAEVEAFEAAFASALVRAPDQIDALRATEKTWRDERDKGCVMPNPDAFERCIVAQYKIRTQELALLVPMTVPSQNDTAIKPGAYVSDAVILQLDPNGEFEMKDFGGGRQANGHYAVAAGMLTLLDGTGDVGATKFPLKCRVLQTIDGFAVKLGQPECRQLDGIAFRFAT